MRYLEYLTTLKRLDYLIRTKQTGTPTQVAEKLEISVATLHRYRRDLLNLRAPIEYDQERECYVYTHDFELKF